MQAKNAPRCVRAVRARRAGEQQRRQGKSTGEHRIGDALFFAKECVIVREYILQKSNTLV